MIERSKPLVRRRADFTQRLFDLLRLAQTCEASLPRSFALASLASESLVQASTLVQPQVRAGATPLGQHKYFSALLMLSVIYFFAMIAIHAVLIVIHARKHRAAGLLEFSIYMTTAFTYIVYPLM